MTITAQLDLCVIGGTIDPARFVRELLLLIDAHLKWIKKMRGSGRMKCCASDASKWCECIARVPES